eukprot:CAMPEP_0185740362 /NCGR_PEP_ID=MMETSP1171-20130828/37592_1 /TAXON_ID=374046 /ORGANISM="Helicotheca tamensis, Strain CCMP826" /LENGTH=588 /DNA_ID=CAMNT_0028412183 /DNA_START=45 /DNA_END=1811 /DNA_ORIENTATION=-
MSEGIPTIVKWGKETIELKLLPDNGVKGLKAELEERTGVPVERMKIMAKSKGLWKGVLKDDFDMTSIDPSKLKLPLQMLLMGSATKLVAPKTKTVFIEDLPPEEVAKHAPEPSGLVNLGNTCYLNSVVQCMRSIPQLRAGLRAYAPPPRNNNNALMGATATSNPLLLSSLRDLFDNLDRNTDAVPPSNFVMATKMAFPQFAQTGPRGQPMQQDAEEFYSNLLSVVGGEMKENCLTAGFQQGGTSASGPTPEELGGAENLADALFGMKMEETLTCDEFSSSETAAASSEKKEDAMDVDTNTSALAEPPVVSYDLHRKLVCNIQGGSDSSAQVNVNHLAEGVALSLSGKIEKHSEILGRDAVWTRTQRIARLPPVLVVQFGRFYWKATPDSADHAGVKCKVMKPVAFTGTFDVYEFCSEKIQKVLKKARDAAAQEEEDRIAKKLKGGDDDEKMESVEGETKEGETATNEDEDEEEAAAMKAALAMSLEEDGEPDAPVGPGLPPDFQGMYELFAVVTHKGRDADGGHYMGWVKAAHQSDNAQKIADTDEMNDDWFVFDDDEVSPCKTEDVLKLKGGGDWHMSYLNFYRAKK